MKITITGPDKKKFKDLDVGAKFSFKDLAFIKVNYILTRDNRYNCVDFENGYLCHMLDEDTVEILDMVVG